jgi:hypothetical protein
MSKETKKIVPIDFDDWIAKTDVHARLIAFGLSQSLRQHTIKCHACMSGQLCSEAYTLYNQIWN